VEKTQSQHGQSWGTAKESGKKKERDSKRTFLWFDNQLKRIEPGACTAKAGGDHMLFQK